MPNKLLIITGIYPPDSGGPAKFAREFSDWLSTEGVEVLVITYSSTQINKFPKSSPVISEVDRNQTLPKRFLKFVHRVGSFSNKNQNVLVAGAFIEAYVASIIYRFSYIAKVPGDIVWERARNNKVTSLNIEDFQEHPLNFKYKIFRILYSRSLSRAKFVIVPSLGLYKLCLKWGVSESKLRLIYNSVESEIESKYYPSLQKDNLITVCRLTPWKGVDELIEYVARRNLTLVVVGDGPDRLRLESLALALNANVVFKGEVAHQKVLALLLQSQLFVLNSYYEGLPHALVEARVAGVLSVGRAGTGSAEVINDDQDGFLVRSDRPLEETLDLAIQMQPSSDSMITLAKEDSLKRFSKAANFPLILKLFLREVR